MLGAVESNNSINTVSFFNARNAFNKASAQKQDINLQQNEVETNIIDNSILRNINIDEIKQYANSVGEVNLSEEDIKYGLRFGRSVLVDYSA